jgi:Ni/Co efflux regulator RcnB
MSTASPTNSRLLKSALLAALLATSAASMASKPESAGQGKPKGQSAQGQAAPVIQIGAYFREEQRLAVSRYYAGVQAKGHCPPGLAKKNNGCMPPGQAKKWLIGQPLPATLVQYQVPSAVIAQIGVAPAGYKYVRVANDILLIALGTMMVVDAIEDLMRP